MKPNEIHVGVHYVTTVTDKQTVVRIQSYDPVKGWEVYNTSTDKTLHIKAACRLLRMATHNEIVNSYTRESLHFSSQKPVEKCENFAVQGNVSEEMMKALDRPRKYMPGGPFEVLSGQKVAGFDDIVRQLRAGASPPHTHFNTAGTQTGRVSGMHANQSGSGSHGYPEQPSYAALAEVIRDLLKESSLQDVQADTGLSEERCKEICEIGTKLLDIVK